MNNEYIYPMCKINYKTGEITKVMCKRSPIDDFNHYGTYWYGYRDKDGKVYYDR